MRTKLRFAHSSEMPNYIRQEPSGRPIFITFKTLPHRTILVEQRDVLRRAIETVQSRRPFAITALVLLPDHLHAIFELPPEDEDFLTRIGVMKVLFSKRIVAVDESHFTEPSHAFIAPWEVPYARPDSLMTYDPMMHNVRRLRGAKHPTRTGRDGTSRRP